MDLAGIRRLLARNYAKQRSFSGTVPTDESNLLAGIDLEGHSLQDFVTAVGLSDV